MGEAKRCAAIRKANELRREALRRVDERQNACGWDANGAPVVDFPPTTKTHEPLAELDSRPSSPRGRSVLTRLAMLTAMALGGGMSVPRFGGGGRRR
jgi:hypothetical protein